MPTAMMPDLQRHPRAEDDAREDVAAEIVGAQRMLDRGWHGEHHVVLDRGIVRSDHVGEERAEDHDRRDRQAGADEPGLEYLAREDEPAALLALAASGSRHCG